MPRIPLNVAATLPRKLGPPPGPLPRQFTPTDAEARSLFRQLWRVGSLSVMYSNPARDVIRQKIREAFDETKKLSETDPQKIRQQWERSLNTKHFLEIASTRFGIEHSVISNLSRISWENNIGVTRMYKPSMWDAQREVAKEYMAVIHALNESMGLCLR